MKAEAARVVLRGAAVRVVGVREAVCMVEVAEKSVGQAAVMVVAKWAAGVREMERMGVVTAAAVKEVGVMEEAVMVEVRAGARKVVVAKVVAVMVVVTEEGVTEVAVREVVATGAVEKTAETAGEQVVAKVAESLGEGMAAVGAVVWLGAVPVAFWAAMVGRVGKAGARVVVVLEVAVVGWVEMEE